MESIEGRRDADEKEKILFMCKVADDADLTEHHQDDYPHSLFGFQIKYKNNVHQLQPHLFADHEELLICVHMQCAEATCLYLTFEHLRLSFCLFIWSFSFAF